MKKLIILMIILSILIVGLVPSVSTILRAECADVEYLTNQSDIIVVGKVLKVESKWDDEKTKIYTFATVSVEKYLKGSGPEEIIVRVEGGEINGEAWWVEDQPGFKEGERVKLYLHEWQGFLTTVCGNFGKKKIVKEQLESPFVEVELPEAGITPDSWLYGLDRASERISLALTFGHSAKAKKGLEHAAERLAEVREMINKQRFGAAEKARKEHSKILEKAKAEVAKIKEKPEKELETEIEIERKIEKHDYAILGIEREIEIKIRGKLTAEQQELVDKLLASFANQTASVKIEIKTKKENTKIKIKEKGLDVNKTEEEIEKKLNITEERKERAAEQIEEAKKEIAKAEKAIGEEGINISDIPAIEKLLDNSKEKLKNAEKAFSEEKYGEAFGQAMAAEKIARNVKRIIEKWEKFLEKWPCKPICMKEDTPEEGWYDSCTYELIKKDKCKGCEAICIRRRTRSEGWYSTCKLKLIIWKKCSPAVPVCGNRICEAGETAENCQQDCEVPKSKPEKEKPEKECEKNEDCNILCPMVVGMDTPQCKNGKCVCGPKLEREKKEVGEIARQEEREQEKQKENQSLISR